MEFCHFLTTEQTAQCVAHRFAQVWQVYFADLPSNLNLPFAAHTLQHSRFDCVVQFMAERIQRQQPCAGPFPMRHDIGGSESDL